MQSNLSHVNYCHLSSLAKWNHFYSYTYNTIQTSLSIPFLINSNRYCSIEDWCWWWSCLWLTMPITKHWYYLEQGWLVFGLPQGQNFHTLLCMACISDGWGMVRTVDSRCVWLRPTTNNSGGSYLIIINMDYSFPLILNTIYIARIIQGIFFGIKERKSFENKLIPRPCHD